MEARKMGEVPPPRLRNKKYVRASLTIIRKYVRPRPTFS